MRCPKCHYISFGSVARCRNCGYEFLLAVEAPAVDLPIQSSEQAIGPLADFVLTERSPAPPPSPAFADLAVSESPAVKRAATAAPASRLDLPLFGGAEVGDDTPLVVPSSVPRPPLSVRRGQPAIARSRSERALPSDASEPESPRIVRRADGRSPELAFSRDVPADARKPAAIESASVVARVAAGLADILVLGVMDGAILYFTLLALDLPLAEIRTLPSVPLGVFLLLVNGGYLALFTTAGGQTIGKMLAGIRVVTDRSAEDLDSGRRGDGVTLGAAVLRATAYLFSLLPAGLGFAAILFDSDGRALHDRLAETRVVKA